MTQDPQPPNPSNPVWPAPARIDDYPYPPLPSPASGMYVAAAVINWVVLGLSVALTCGIGVILAAWFIPMTLQIHKGSKDRYKHTALGVCTLLFCNPVSGILMLVEDSNRADRPVF